MSQEVIFILKILAIVIGYPVFVLGVRKAMNCPSFTSEGMVWSFVGYWILLEVVF
jgi:hypothetical protein